MSITRVLNMAQCDIQREIALKELCIPLRQIAALCLIKVEI